MQVGDLISSGTLYVPWPTVVGTQIVGSHGIKESLICAKKCTGAPQCAPLIKPKGEHVCSFGMTFIKDKIHDVDVTVYGVRGPSNPNTARAQLKDALKGRFVTPQQVREWVTKAERLLNDINDDFLRRQSEMLEPLHDPMRLVTQIQGLAQRVVEKENPGLPLDTQIERAGYEAKSLVRAAGLLGESFELLAIYFNPDAAAYGRKVRFQLHGLLRKLQAIFSIRDFDSGSTNNPRIYLDGHSYREVEVYESFKVIPFALIGNAVKYSLSGDIRIRLAERQTTVETSIESTGPYIEPDELDRIYDRRFRGRWARQVTDGTGVGLYLAKIVAEANRSNLRALSHRLPERDTGGIPLALNRFTFDAPLV